MSHTDNLPPLPGHPEPHTMTWSALESAAILEYGKACALAATPAPAAPPEPVASASIEHAEPVGFQYLFDSIDGEVWRDAPTWNGSRAKGSRPIYALPVARPTPQPRNPAPSPRGDSFVFDSQFLSDVLTAAGLVSNGRRSKNLGERLGKAVVTIRSRATPPAAHAGLTDAHWTDAKLRGIASDYFQDAKDWPAAMLCMRHMLMEQRAAIASTPAPVKAEGWKLVPVQNIEMAAALMDEAASVFDAFDPEVLEKLQAWRWPLTDELGGAAHIMRDSLADVTTPPAAQGAPVMAEALTVVAWGRPEHDDVITADCKNRLLTMGGAKGSYRASLFSRALVRLDHVELLLAAATRKVQA